MAIHAILVGGIGRYVIRQLTQGDHVVMAGATTVVDTCVVISAGSKGAWTVANAAILNGWHVVGVHTDCRSRAIGYMTGEAAITHDTGMIKSRIGEIVGVMADATVLGGYRVCRYRCPLARGVDTVGIAVAGFAGHDRGVNQAVIEYAAEAESRDFVAGTAIEGRQIDFRHRGMTSRGVADIVAGRYTMTSIATGPDNDGVGVIRKRVQKTFRRMTTYAFSDGNRMVARWSVGGRGRFANGRGAVVAALASTRNTRMIKAAIPIQFKKAGGIVAVIAFAIRREVKFGLADGDITVVTVAAIAEHFLMVDKGDDVESQGGVAGFTHIAGGDMATRFAANGNKVVIVAVDAARR